MSVPGTPQSSASREPPEAAADLHEIERLRGSVQALHSQNATLRQLVAIHDRLGGLVGALNDWRLIWYVCVDPELMKLAVLRLLDRHAVRLLLHTTAIGAVADAGRVTGLRVLDKSGERVLRAPVFVDCSGDADLAAWAGAAVEKGGADGSFQPVSLMFRMSGVETAPLLDFVQAHPEHFALGESDAIRGGRTDREIAAEIARQGEPCVFLKAEGPLLGAAIASGEMYPTALVMVQPTSRARREVCLNTTRVANIDATRTAALSATLTELSRQVMQCATFVQRRVPGFAGAAISALAPRIGIRETRRIMGEYKLTYDDVKNADLVIEAVFEDMEVKKGLFARLDALSKPQAILATNTSRLDVNEIARSTSRPASVIGLHFFSPANVMRLLEVVRGADTAADIIATCMDLARRIGKLPVLVGVCDGFVGNRMVAQYAREAEFLLEEGATPQQVDGALQKFGLAMGRFAMSDLAGLDISWSSRKRAAATRPAHLRYSKVADRLCEMGRFGQKTGAGFYRYETGSRTPLPDPVVQQVIEDCAREAGIARRTISDEEIVERTIYALVNEGAKVLEDGIAQRASDIDLIYVNGYGFPAWRGGPMFYADTVGLAKVYERVCEFHRQQGEFWKPAPLLARLAQSGKTFAKPD